MTDEELRDLVAETSRVAAETSRRVEQTSRKVEEVGRQIGWIGNTFGRFTEGLFLPSLEKILIKDFGLDTVAPRIQRRQNGSFVELDVLAYSNGGNNTAVVVEIKSKLRDDDIKEFLRQLSNFPKLFPEHKDKKLFGMIAAVGITAEQKAALEKLGIYVVRIKDDVFKVISSKKFKPHDFGLKP